MHTPDTPETPDKPPVSQNHPSVVAKNNAVVESATCMYLTRADKAALQHRAQQRRNGNTAA